MINLIKQIDLSSLPKQIKVKNKSDKKEDIILFYNNELYLLKYIDKKFDCINCCNCDFRLINNARQIENTTCFMNFKATILRDKKEKLNAFLRRDYYELYKWWDK